MFTKTNIITMCLLTSLLLTGCGGESAQSATTTPVPKLKYEVEDTAAPVVYFTKDVSPEGLMKVYKKLGQDLQGKVGIKVSFGGDNEQYLDPELMRNLIQETGGTFIDTNGFTAPRNTSEGNRTMAEKHGFTKVAPVDILDEEGDIDLPVTGGYHLTHARTGAHFDRYDTFIAVHRFKAHYLPIYGGNMKNISLSLGSLSGKALIHSAGEVDSYYKGLGEKETAESFADAAKAAMDYKKGHWAFINVMDAFVPTDNCTGTKNLGNIGILASLDPVAIDAASVDFEYGAAPDEDTRAKWEEAHSTDILDYAEKIGVGKRHYRLIHIDENEK